MPNPLVSIGLVIWNSAKHLPNCLNGLAQQIYAPLEVIVVDNASVDNSLDVVCATFNPLQFVHNPENRGFCGGHNQAINMAHGKYYMPLNPDVVMRPEYIAVLVEALETHCEYGSAAGKLLRSAPDREPARIDTTGLFIDRRRQQHLRGYGEPDCGQYDRAGEVFGVDGAAPLYRRQMLESIKIGDEYFDESFFSHKEDVDLAWRAQIAGWKCWYTPAAVAIHPRNFRPGQRTTVSATIRLNSVKNRYLLLLRNESRAGWQRDGLHILWYDLKIIAYLSLFERTSLAAFGILRRRWPTIMAWRKEIWARAQTSPEKLLQWFE